LKRVNNQQKNIKKEGFLARKKKHLKKKRVSTGFCRVARVTGHPGGSIKFCQVFAHPILLPYPDQSSYRVDPPGQFGFINYNYYHHLYRSYYFIFIITIIIFIIILLLLPHHHNVLFYFFFFACVNKDIKCCIT
jgi:hypothetical protein